MSTAIVRPAVAFRMAPFFGFAGFGAFWGVWGAALPLLRAQAGVSDAEFGVALLLVGAGALPAMLLAGRLVDAVGLRVAGILLALLGVMGVVLAAGSVSYGALCVGILLVGASSGAADVAINTLAATVEKRTGRPVVARSHATFSATVAVSSLGAGALAALADSLLVTFAAAAIGVAAFGLAVVVSTHSAPAGGGAAPGSEGGVVSGSEGVSMRRGGRGSRWVALIVIGAIGALAFAAENAYQTWVAVLLTDAFAASPALAAVAPAAFATTAALTRLATAAITMRRAIATLVVASLVATAGGVLTAFAPTLPLALAGIVAAAAGASVLFPTLLSYGLRPVADESRGRATSAISTVAYLGYLAGPAYFGLLADATGVQPAFVGVAVLTAVLPVTIPALSIGRRSWLRASAPG
ncbi:MFS transporter [Nonomuraea sp. B12E4]|uniref:MFS transporter n=1 Tax=Nonomuraea sp. B12E4 TaxID=3153564 RepID=UPI00325F4D03